MAKTIPWRQCPVCDDRTNRPYRPGPGGRPDAACPSCRSLERHRFLALLLRRSAFDLLLADTVLDVAPSRYTTRLLEELGARAVIGVDLDPAADGRHIDLQASLTQLPLADDSIDLMLCYHVLEHVPDDRAGMAEMRRVLSARGRAVVQVPWRPDRPTDEDPDADEATRLERFGQADHVRYYGADLEDRFLEAGLDVCRVRPGAVLAPSECARYHVPADDVVWIVRPSATERGTLHVLSTTPLDLVVESRAAELSAALRTARAELRAATAAAQQLNAGGGLAGRARRAVGRARRR